MAKKGQFDVNKIHYVHIRDIAINYMIPEDVPMSQDRREPIQFNLEIVKTLGIDDKIIRLIFTIVLKTFGKDKKEASATYVTEHLFNVENISELASINGNEFEVDDILDNTITGLAYSTVRGLVHQKFAGTWFSNFILPITKPADLGKAAE